MRTFAWLCPVGVLLFVASIAAQSPTGKPAPPRPNRTVSPPFTPMASVKDIMDGLVDPQSDVIFEAVATIATKSGIEERAPKTDADWEAVRTGALLLNEGAHLLMVQGRHVAGPGAKSEVPGVELEPAEMEALINKNWELFRKHAQGLVSVVTLALRAIDAKDAPGSQQCRRGARCRMRKLPCRFLVSQPARTTEEGRGKTEIHLQIASGLRSR